MSYTRAVKSILMLARDAVRRRRSPARAQPAEKITVMLDARTEGRADPRRRGDAAARRGAARPRGDRRRRGGAAEHARRTIWIVTGATPGPLAASVIVTERYDRETLMVLGIEDDDMAQRMMALQIVVDHQIFTGPDRRRSPGASSPRSTTASSRGCGRSSKSRKASHRRFAAAGLAGERSEPRAQLVAIDGLAEKILGAGAQPERPGLVIVERRSS